MLHEIQTKLKAPKGQHNSFGGYKYRSCEDILEAVKKVLPKGSHITLDDEIVQVGERYYVKATASLFCEGEIYQATAFAREAAAKKGMDESQITGATSSYARKYALNGLFCIDDTKDADTDEHAEEAKNTPERDLTDKEKHVYKDITFLLNAAQDEIEIKSIMDEYEACIEGFPENIQIELSDVVEKECAKRAGGVVNQSCVYHFMNVKHALDYKGWLEGMIPEATDAKKLEAYINRWDPKLQALDKTLGAEKYLKDGKSPYQQVIDLYNDKMVQLLKQKETA